MKQLGFAGDIEKDFLNLESFIEKFAPQSNILFSKSKKIKMLDRKLFILKNCIQNINTSGSLMKAFSLLLLAFTYIIRGEGYTAITISRPSMELFLKILLEDRNKCVSNNFSNNLERIMKLIKKNYSDSLGINNYEIKENLSPKINNFTQKYQKLYWQISDYTHVSKTDLLTNDDLIKSIILNYDFSNDNLKKCEFVMTILIRVINFCIELIILNSSILITNEISSELLSFYTEDSTNEYLEIQSYVYLKI